VSHGKIRTEKVCLNCGSETTGRYCSACGQENIEPKQTVWHLVQHFFSDITHFDGKFFVTVKDLFAKPGFLSSEYMIGRRASYLDPIRMYIFTSAFFFLIFFSLFDVKQMHVGKDLNKEVRNDPDFRALVSKAKTTRDSLEILREYHAATSSIVKITTDSSQITPGIHTRIPGNYASVKQYDSVQKTLPLTGRDGWVKRRVEIRKIEITERYKKEGNDLIRDMINHFMHEFPKALFISLPAFALILKLLYIRHKRFFYTDHGIFSIHLYIFSFLVLLVFFGINGLTKTTGWSILGWLEAAVLIYPLIYYYKAMRRFYSQSRAKTILKYLLLFIFSFIVQIIILAGFILFTVLEA
jgi:RNA polymerase subunit RPABC4/transcription elongation factor Spt4